MKSTETLDNNEVITESYYRPGSNDNNLTSKLLHTETTNAETYPETAPVFFIEGNYDPEKRWRVVFRNKDHKKYYEVNSKDNILYISCCGDKEFYGYAIDCATAQYRS